MQTSARFITIGIAATSLLVGILSVFQARRIGAIKMLTHPGQRIEKLPQRAHTPTRVQAPTEVHMPEMVQSSRETRRPIDHMPLIAPVTDYQYYEELAAVEYPPDRKRASQYGYYSRL